VVSVVSVVSAGTISGSDAGIYYWDGKIKAGSVSDLPNYFADLMPTFADLAGAGNRIPEGLDGISITPRLLNSGEQQKHEYLYWELPAFDWDNNRYNPEELQQAIRVDNWKMLRHHMAESWELYDLGADPEEQNDLSTDKPEIVNMLLQKITENRTEMPEQIEPEMPEGKWFR